jgi:hypothetical protein
MQEEQGVSQDRGNEQGGSKESEKAQDPPTALAEKRNKFIRTFDPDAGENCSN